jgi:hypothetical protein
MIRQDYATVQAVGGPVTRDRIRLETRPRRARGVARGSLRALAGVLKLLVAIPLGIAVAVTVWLLVQLLKL